MSRTIRRTRSEPLSTARIITRILFIALGLLFAGIGGLLLLNTYKFQETAISATARVLAVETFSDHSRDRDGRKKITRTYLPTLSYVDGDGAEWRVKPRVRSSSYNFPVGAEIGILVDPKQPRNVRINDFLTTWGFGTIFAVFGLFFAGLGYFITKR